MPFRAYWSAITLGELNDCGLGRCIGDIGHAKPADSRHASDVDDRPLALPLHIRKHMLAGQEHALQIDVVDPVPALLGGLDRAADFNDPDVVVQHVDPAERRNAGTD